jgi:predicted nuclease of restriction endonuclease-like (RecB) superfamily
MPGKKRAKPAVKRKAAAPPAERLNFASLVAAIQRVHEGSAAAASRAVNVSLTLRNWVIGWYIREYEQQGEDRATYGDVLIDALAKRLGEEGVEDLAARTLRQCRQFYTVYPTIWQTPSANSIRDLLPEPIWQTLSAKLPAGSSKSNQEASLTEKVGTSSPELQLPTNRLANSLSFSHFVELIAIDDPLKRAFYEVECIRGNWSVRALKRQIASLYFERSGLSRKPEKLAAMVKAEAEKAEPKLTIRDPYIFEFLGLKAQDAVEESDLEAALVTHLREFLLELGNGFCLEAQQKSIVIGNTRGFVDLVFYHRVLKCHVLVDLKVDEFRHEHIGQLNTYVTWYRKHMMAEGDNPPVGLLLCTQKDHALVEYALAAIDNRLFVSKYQLELPSTEDLRRFLEKKRREVGDR